MGLSLISNVIDKAEDFNEERKQNPKKKVNEKERERIKKSIEDSLSQVDKNTERAK